MMDFFEALTEKTLEREQDRVGRSVYLSAGVQRGIEATIEALKEMMVGEPIRGSLGHVLNLPDAPHTMLDNSAVKDPAYGEALFERHIGTDGEEVVVMVFKKP